MNAADGPSVDTVKTEIVSEIMRVHEDSYGTTVSDVEVLLGETAVLVTMGLELTRAEQTMIEGGFGGDVVRNRESYQVVIESTFRAVVERATGRRVIGFASRTILDGRAWSAEIFRLADPAPGVQRKVQ